MAENAEDTAVVFGVVPHCRAAREARLQQRCSIPRKLQNER
jgi:hypothetical protein